jgi:hypothetical protein
MILALRKARWVDAFHIHLRDTDFEEANLWSPGVGPYAALAHSIQTSPETFTVFEGADVVCIYGHSKSDQEVHPWLMCSNIVNRHSRPFLRGAHRFIKQLRRDNPDKLICNYVNKTNLKAKRLLSFLGFRWVHSPGESQFDFFYLP